MDGLNGRTSQDSLDVAHSKIMMLVSKLKPPLRAIIDEVVDTRG